METKTPVGISYPILRGENGYFQEQFSTPESIRDSIANLLLTPIKTRPGRPEYGNSFYERILFEGIQSDTNDEIKEIIESDIETWIPEIEIKSIKLSSPMNLNRENSVFIFIEYTIKNTPISDTIDVTVSL